METLLLLVCCIFAQTVIPVRGQQTLPTIEDCPSPLVVAEDTEVGVTLFSLRARVNEESFPANNLTLTLESDSTGQLVNITDIVFINDSGSGQWQWSADVVLRTPLDRDFEPSTRFLSFGATDSKGNRATRICNLNIQDVNDNAPSFQGLPFDFKVNEMTAVGTVLGKRISATDPDTAIGGQVFLLAEFQDSSVEEMFNMTTSVEGSGQVLDIVLARPLDYESRTFYTFNVRAVDGAGLNSSAVVRVTVSDAQDTPPVFLLDTYRALIREHQPKGTAVITVSAEDGDRDPANAIVYSIVEGRTDYFSIDNTTGRITSSAELDRDNSSVVDTEGVFRLIVRATETDDAQPQYGNTTTEVEVVVVVEDINDHPPVFSSTSPYTAFVREDTPEGALIYFDGDGYISVSDADQGRNSYFNLTVERGGVPWAKVVATPTEVYSEALVLLRVTEPDVFKEFAGTHISLQLVAREVSTEERHSSTAEVVITVQRLPEPSPSPVPATNDDITAPDIVVFVIGFLVIFNVVTTILIVCYVRRRRDEVPRQGLARKGSKYYVNGVEKESSRPSSGFQNGSAVSLRSESVLVEVEGKDRCDVVPLSAVLPDSQDSPAVSDTRSGSGGNNRPRSTDRKVLLSNEVSPARSVSLSTSAESVATSQGTPRSSTTVIVNTGKDGLPDFSKARRNVSSQKNPALTFSVPDLNCPSDTATIQGVSTSSPASIVGVTSFTTPSTSAESVSLQPMTRFSANGAISTTTTTAVAPVASGQPASSTASLSSSKSGVTPAGSAAVSMNGSVTEILY